MILDDVICSVVQALAKLAMDKAFDFQELRKPGDTDLVAIDRVFEKCPICKETGHTTRTQLEPAENWIEVHFRHKKNGKKT